ncbi:two-partner secretion domain-containing protein [Testudinibacter sp. P27/CKL/0425]
MNKHLFNVIFSQSKQLFVVVSEYCRHDGKTPRSSAIKTTRLPLFIPYSLTTLNIAMLLVFSSDAASRIIADPTAQSNQKATVLIQNGKPLINIRTPSTAGVSHNVYQQFDVDSEGVILNNSKNNPWLEKNEAKVILNEVNSHNASKLEGAIAVQGRKADVIIANQSGITVNGASFTNAGNVTLTTGKPALNQGDIGDITVEKGVITVGKNGLDSRQADYTQLLARTATIQGKVQAKSLGIVTGKNKINYQNGTIQVQKGKGERPQVAIDVAELGGMYAGKINLLATESGVGVKNLGTLQATNGQLILTADGKLENRGTLQSDIVSLATVRDDIENSGKLQGKSAVMISAGRDAILSGNGITPTRNTQGKETLAQGQVVIQAKGKVKLHDNTRIESSKSVPQQDIQLAADKIDTGVNVQLVSAGELKMAGKHSIVTRRDTQFSAEKDIVLYSNRDIHLLHTQLKSEKGNLVLQSEDPVVSAKDKPAVNTTPLADIMLEEGSLFAGKHILMKADKKLHLFRTQIDKATDMNLAAGDKLSYFLPMLKNSTTDQNNLTGNVSLYGKRITLGNAPTTAKLQAQNISLIANDGLLSIGDNNQLSAKKNLDIAALNGDIQTTNLHTTALNGTLSVLAKHNTRLMEKNSIKTVLQGKHGMTLGSVGNGILQLPTAFRSNAENGNIHLQAGGHLTTDFKHAENKSRGLSLVSDTGNIELKNATLELAENGLLLNAGKGAVNIENVTANAANGMISISAQANIKLSQTQLNAKEIVISSNKEINQNQDATTTNRFIATDILSLYSAGSQHLNNTTLQGGALILTAKHGGFNIQGNTDWKSVGSANLKNNSKTKSINGAFSIESKNHLTLLPQYSLRALSDLSIKTQNHLLLRGIAGKQGNSSAQVVKLNAGGRIDLTAGAVTLEASELKSNHINITSTTGNIELTALKNSAERYSDVNAAIILLKKEIQHIEEQAEKIKNSRKWGGFKRLELRKRLAPLREKQSQIQSIINIMIGPKKGYEHRGATLTAGAINLLSTGSIRIESAKMVAGDTVNIKSLGTTPTKNEQPAYGVLINGSLEVFEKGKEGHNSHSYAVFNTPTEITAKNGITIESTAQSADANLIISATDLQAPNGKISLYAYNDMRLESGQEEFYSYNFRSYKSGKWYKRKRVTETNTSKSSTANPASLTAQSLDLKAGGNIELYATELNAPKGSINITAGKALSLYAVDEENYHKHEKTKKSKYFGFISGGRSTSSSSKALQSALPARLVAKSAVTHSCWDTLLQGTQFTILTPAHIRVGVGEHARKDAKIMFEGIKTKVIEIQKSQSKSALWQSMKDRGSIVETLNLPTFTGPTPVFTAPGGLSVQLPQGAFRTEVEKLAKQPGMEYLNSIIQRKDVDWKRVKLEYEKWNHSQQGLSGAGAIIVAIAVAVATGGAGAAAFPTLATTAVGEAMVNAAMTSLITQASISTINNRGDLGKVFKDLGSKQTVKSLATAVVTAGVMEKAGGLGKMQQWKNSDIWTDKLSYNLVNNGISALSSATINGESLEKALKRGLLSAIAETGQGIAANHIKGLSDFSSSEFANRFVHKLAHAVAGCGAGATVGGKCVDGAVGAVIGEITAEIIGNNSELKYTKEEQDKLLGYAKIAAASVTAYLGGNANTAVDTAHTAVMNNYLSDWQEKQKQHELAQCATAYCRVITHIQWTVLSAGQDASFATGMLAAVPESLYDMVKGLADMAVSPIQTFKTAKTMIMHFLNSKIQ